MTLTQTGAAIGVIERQPPAVAPPKVCIVDFATGRLAGGHQEDYLVALTDALSARPLTVVAPFRGARPPRGRMATWLAGLLAFRRALRARSLVVVHTPEFRDIVLFAAASLLWRGGAGVFVLRRDGAGIVGRPGRKAGLIEALVPWLIGRNRLYPVSDSRSVLDRWLARSPAAAGSLVALPCLRPDRATPFEDGPRIGLLGRFRAEKGGSSYDAVIRSALDLLPAGRVRVHLSTDHDGEAGDLARRLLSDWPDEPRVELCSGHRPAEAYAADVAACDVVVLPYDIASYGGGSSGVLHDALALGRVVLATRFAWATERFADHAGVVWLADTSEAEIRRGLYAAIERAREGRQPPPIEDSFAADWQAALVAAAGSIGVKKEVRGE